MHIRAILAFIAIILAPMVNIFSYGRPKYSVTCLMSIYSLERYSLKRNKLIHLIEGSEGKCGVPMASRKKELRLSSICRAFISMLVQRSVIRRSMFFLAQPVITFVPFLTKSITISCGSSLACRTSLFSV